MLNKCYNEFYDKHDNILYSEFYNKFYNVCFYTVSWVR